MVFREWTVEHYSCYSAEADTADEHAVPQQARPQVHEPVNHKRQSKTGNQMSSPAYMKSTHLFYKLYKCFTS